LKKEINLSVIIPCFNEQKNILKTIKKVESVLNNYSKYEILIVNDGSTDNSKFIVDDFIKKKTKLIRIISINKNQGVQNAIYVGAKNSKYKYVTHFPGDDSFERKSIRNLIKYTGIGGLVLGFRKDYHSKINFIRRILSKSLILLMQISTNTKIKDFHGPYICETKFLKKKIKSKRYDGQIEVINHILNQGVSVIEVPVYVRIKTITNTNVVKIGVCIGFLKTLLRLFIYNLFKKK
tara:strand:+ start:1643 stop:2350 length:708 start_codon:yes stop_codon:yes gene_type:complete